MIDLTDTYKWCTEYAKPGEVLVECIDCGRRSIVETEDDADYEFWASSTKAGECIDCHGPEMCVAACPPTDSEDTND